MRPIILTFLFFSFSLTFFSQKKDPYKRFKKGEFAYVGQENAVKIIRTKRKQIEVFGDGKSKLILKIDWTNDSTYVLTHLKSINANGCLKKGEQIITTIINSTADKYTCFYTTKNCGEGRSAIIKLK